jgi:hypothetical protein
MFELKIDLSELRQLADAFAFDSRPLLGTLPLLLSH